MRELPARKRARFEALGLSRYDTLLLADDVATAEYFDAATAAGAPPKLAANWILSDLSKHCNVRRSRGPTSELLHIVGESRLATSSVLLLAACRGPSCTASSAACCRRRAFLLPSCSLCLRRWRR